MASMPTRLEQLQRLVHLDSALAKGIGLMEYATAQGISQAVLRSDMDLLRGLGADIEAVMVKERGEIRYVQRHKRGWAVFADWVRRANG
jgi:hypothetical protein